jgi:hypothetical protein
MVNRDGNCRENLVCHTIPIAFMDLITVNKIYCYFKNVVRALVLHKKFSRLYLNQPSMNIPSPVPAVVHCPRSDPV